MNIGEVARRASVTADTIRYYERVGLLPKPPRTAAGYRQYGPGIVDRLAVVRNAQRFGFSLHEIAGFLRVRDAGGKPCHDVRAGAQRLLQAVDRQIAALTGVRRDMRRTLRAWDRKLEATAPNELAHLLEAGAARRDRPSGQHPDRGRARGGRERAPADIDDRDRKRILRQR